MPRSFDAGGTQAGHLFRVKYLNLSSALDGHDLMIRSTTAQIGVWFILQCYCHRQVNGGKILNCKDWPASAWARIGIEKSQVEQPSELWHFAGPGGNALILHLYDAQAEQAYQRQQEAGRASAAKRKVGLKHRKIVPLEMGERRGDREGERQRREGGKEG